MFERRFARFQGTWEYYGRISERLGKEIGQRPLLNCRFAIWGG